MYSIDTQVIPAYSQKYIQCVIQNSGNDFLLLAEPNPEDYSEKGIFIAESVTDPNLLKQYLLVVNTTGRDIEITNEQWLAECHDVAFLYENNDEMNDLADINVISSSKIVKNEIIPSTLQTREAVISHFKTQNTGFRY
jgi:hypothetical protein